MNGSIRQAVCRQSVASLVIFLLLGFKAGYPQDTTKTVLNPNTINLYLDSPDYYIDLDFYRTEIPFVNYMRDRADADVQILMTTQGTGGGGREFTINFIGLRRFDGQKNILKYISKQTDTEDIIRKELARHFKIGLMQFVAQSPEIGQIDILYKKPAQDQAKTKDKKDPWDYWTFRTSLTGSLNGEKTYKYNYLYASFSANRVTENWKFNANFSASNTKTRYDYGEDLSYTDLRRSRYMSASAIKSITTHWSFGLRGSASNSTYNNSDLALSFSPGIEFNVFPYSESTRRQFTFQYLVGVNYYDYHEETIYLKMSEQRYRQSLNIEYEIKQPWGAISSYLNGSHYLYDINKFNVQLGGEIDLKLIKGFSLYTYGYLTFVRDQLSLPSSGASIEEILLRRRQLETSYYYYAYFGISYTFGSIYNNVVNPRFRGL